VITFLTFLLVFLLAWPLGLYIARFMRGERTFLDFLNPLERAFYRLLGVKFNLKGGAQGMDWRGYAKALLFSNLLVGLVAFLIYVFQGGLPFLCRGQNSVDAVWDSDLIFSRATKMSAPLGCFCNESNPGPTLSR
jgi:K+-transporting ATPase A subunit